MIDIDYVNKVAKSQYVRGEGHTVHTLYPLERHFFVDIRAALTYPAYINGTRRKGYYLVFGQTDPEFEEEDRLYWLAEGSNDRLIRLADQVSEACSLLGCSCLYVDQSDEHAGDLEVLNECLRQCDLSVNSAPYASNVMFGLNLIEELKNRHALRIPNGSQLIPELTSLKLETLQEDAVRGLPRVAALRFLAGSFHKNKPLKIDWSVIKRGRYNAGFMAR